MASRTFLCPPGTKHTAPRISNTATCRQRKRREKVGVIHLFQTKSDTLRLENNHKNMVTNMIMVHQKELGAACSPCHLYVGSHVSLDILPWLASALFDKPTDTPQHMINKMNHILHPVSDWSGICSFTCSALTARCSFIISAWLWTWPSIGTIQTKTAGYKTESYCLNHQGLSAISSIVSLESFSISL